MHRFLNLKLQVVVLIIAGSSNAIAGAPVNCDPVHLGRFINASLDQKYNEAFVEVTQEPKDIQKFEVFIPSANKSIPYILTAVCTKSGYDAFEINEQGSGQFDIGSNPRITIIGDDLYIDTGIHVPGFNGMYHFTRQK